MSTKLLELVEAVKTSDSKVSSLRAQQQAFQDLAAYCTAADPATPSLAELKGALTVLEEALLHHCSGQRTPTESLDHSSYFAALLKAIAAISSEVKQAHGLSISTFVPSLSKFWSYGLSLSSEVPGRAALLWRGNSQSVEASQPRRSAYVPPHLRQRTIAEGHADARLSGSEGEASDSEGALGGGDRFRSSKVRLAALSCLQTLAKLDPKALHPLWLGLLPACPPPALRKQDMTLLDVIIGDPSVKARVAAGGAVAALLEGPQQRAYFAIAERRTIERQPARAFTTLSASLGQVAVATHEGLLQAVSQASSPILLASALRALTPLVAAAPYPRLPEDLLVRVMQVLQKFLAASSTGSISSHTVQSATLTCLVAAFGNKPPHPALSGFLNGEHPASEDGRALGAELVTELLQTAQSGHIAVCIEATAALKEMARNYPAALSKHWGWVLGLAEAFTCKHTSGSSQADQDDVCAMHSVRLVAALLASSLTRHPVPAIGNSDDARGRDHLNENGRTSHAAALVQNSLVGSEFNDHPVDQAQSRCLFALEQACSSLLPKAAAHRCSMVRGAAFGIPGACSASAFAVLPLNLQQQVVQLCLDSAERDSVPAVRAAAAKAIGQFGAFPLLLAGSGSCLSKLSQTLSALLEDEALSVRIQGASALASIADSLHAHQSSEPAVLMQSLQQLTADALKAASDSDKVSLNGIRALGHLLTLSDTQPGHGTVGQALDCCLKALTAGSYKAQWNACYAVGNLLRHQQTADPGYFSLQNAAPLLARLAQIVLSSPNFKSRMHAAAALSALQSRRQCIGVYEDICYSLLSALREADDPSYPEDSELINESQQLREPAENDFRSFPAMRRQLKTTLAHFLAMPD